MHPLLKNILDPPLLSKQNFSFNLTIFIQFPSQVKYICVYIAALYINIRAPQKHKSNITKIYYCWPPIFSFLLFKKTVCISDILRILVCDMAAMPGTLIPFAVRENLRSQS